MIRIIFDTETTGLLRAAATPIAKQPKIIELFALVVEGPKLKEVDTFSSLINPHEKLDPKITEITSITDAMLKGKPRWNALHKDIVKVFSKAAQVVGHNLTFDMDMVDNETRRFIGDADQKITFPWPAKKLCTVEATEHILGRRMKLTELHTHLCGAPFDGAHRAEADVRAVHNCMIELLKRGEIA